MQKKDILVVILMASISFFSFVLGTYYNLAQCPSLQCADVTCETQDPQTISISCPDQIMQDCEEPLLFQQILDNLVEEKEYRLNEYDCTEYSNELTRRLQDEGWPSMGMITKVDCESGLFDEDTCKKSKGIHKIVSVSRIYLEATTGEIISPRDYGHYGIR